MAKCVKCGTQVERHELPNIIDRREFGIFCGSCQRQHQQRSKAKEQ